MASQPLSGPLAEGSTALLQGHGHGPSGAVPKTPSRAKVEAASHASVHSHTPPRTAKSAGGAHPSPVFYNQQRQVKVRQREKLAATPPLLPHCCICCCRARPCHPASTAARASRHLPPRTSLARTTTSRCGWLVQMPVSSLASSAKGGFKCRSWCAFALSTSGSRPLATYRLCQWHPRTCQQCRSAAASSKCCAQSAALTYATFQVAAPAGKSGESAAKSYQFHGVLPPNCKQADVLRACGITQLLDAALAGAPGLLHWLNAAVQTGSDVPFSVLQAST